MMRAIVALFAGLAAALILPAHDSLAQDVPPAVPDAQEPVVAVSVRSVHRAYPTRIFAARRVLNDVVGDMEVAIFHDAERGMSAAWFRMVRGETIEFSGAAAGAVADDLTTVTRWDLTTGVAVGGNLQGLRLVPLPVATTTWASWAATHPNGQLYRDGR